MRGRGWRPMQCGWARRPVSGAWGANVTVDGQSVTVQRRRRRRRRCRGITESLGSRPRPVHLAGEASLPQKEATEKVSATADLESLKGPKRAQKGPQHKPRTHAQTLSRSDSETEQLHSAEWKARYNACRESKAASLQVPPKTWKKVPSEQVPAETRMRPAYIYIYIYICFVG
jgi:hypothetical protein